MTKDEIWPIFDNIHGWMANEDFHVLYDYTKDLKGIILEIGSYKGKSTVLMALASIAKVYTIDSFRGRFADGYQEFLNNTNGLNVELIKETSGSVEWNKKIDFLFIDGNHSYSGVKEDLFHFAPFLKKGHYALFHDYNVEKDTYCNEPYGVREVINKFGGRFFSEIKPMGGFAVCKKL